MNDATQTNPLLSLSLLAMSNEQTSVGSDIKAANKSIMDRVHAVSKERMVAIMK